MESPHDPTQVNGTNLNPSQTGWNLIYLPQKMKGWVDLGVNYIPRWFTCLYNYPARL